jgi:3-phytase
MNDARIKYAAGVGFALGAVLIALAARGPERGKGVKDSASSPVVTPAPAGETDPVPNEGDAADDPAIWVHPTDPAKSLILGTDKAGGLIAYDLSGRQLQIASDGCGPNNVDLLYGLEIADGRKVDLAIASTRGAGAEGVKVWAIDQENLRLSDVTAGRGAVIRVFGGSIPYGICTYRSRSGKAYFFVTGKDGRIEQHELAARDGKVSARKVRGLKLSSVVEGAVADEERGVVYFGEEGRGIWRAGAEPDATDTPVLVARVGEHGLSVDVEGLTIYPAPGGKGYLIASSQGNNTFKVYRREGNNEFVCTIDPKNGKPPARIDDVEDTDGIAVSNRPAGDRYAKGLLVVQDGRNDKGRQNFKMYRWEDVAGPAGLIVDTSVDPRGK